MKDTFDTLFLTFRSIFTFLAERFEDRSGGYTRIVRLPEVRLGDAGAQALIEFVGERDRVKSRRRTAPVVEEEAPATTDDAPEDEAADSADAPEAAEEKDGE